MNLGFLNPWLLAGLLGIAVPILIHLYDRRRANRVRFAAIDFILRSRRAVTRYVRVRQWLLLALRVGAVAAIAAAIAKPILAHAVGEGGERAAATHVLLLDDSPASGAEIGGSTVWARTIARAREIAERLAKVDQIAVVRLSEAADLQALPYSGDTRAALATASTAGSMPVAVDGVAALSRAVDLVRGSKLDRRVVHVVSRFPRGTWRTTVRGAVAGRGGAPVSVRWHTVGPDEVLGNLAVEDVEPEAGIDTEGRRVVRVRLRVRNFGEADAERVPVAVEIEGEAPLRAFVDVPADAAADVAFSIAPGSPGPYLGEVRLGDDALALDNRRAFVFDPGSRIRTLLVDGDPRPNVYERETFYLEKALNPLQNPASMIQPRVVGEGGFESVELGAYQVIVLANLAYPKRADDLEAFVRGGGGLLITAGENVDPDTYNEAFAMLLPERFHLTTRFGSATDGDDLQAERVGFVEPDSPFANLFEGIHREQFFRVPFYRALLTTRAADDRIATPVQLRNGAALVISHAVGRGRVAVYTSTVDREWSDFSIRSTFPPFAHVLVQHLARREQDTDVREVVLGDGVTLRTAAQASRGRVLTPTGRTLDLVLDADREGASGSLRTVTDPGLYDWEIWAPDGEWKREGAFAANPAPGIGDLRVVPPEGLTAAATARAGDVETSVASATPTRRTPLWTGLLVLAAAFVAFEGALAAWMGGRPA